MTLSESLDATNTLGLIKFGAGVLTLSGSNGYTGVTTILAGTLSLAGANALGGGGSLRFGGGTLQAGTNGATYSNDVTGSGSAILVDSNGQGVTLSGSLGATNAGGLTKFGAGVLTLSGSNGFTGVTTLRAGTLNLGGTNALSGGGSLTFGGGTLQAGTNGATYSNRLTGSGSAMFVDSNGQNVTLSGSLDATNTGGLTKFGAGVLTLSGSNSFTGVTTLGAGTLSLGGTNAVGGGGSVTFSGGTLQFSAGNKNDYASRIVNSTGVVAIDTNGQGVTFAGMLNATNAGGLTKLGAGTLTLSGSNGYTGVTTILAGTLSLAGANVLGGGGSLTFGGGTLQAGTNGAIYSNAVTGSGSAIFVDSNGKKVALSGSLDATNTGGLTKFGAGTLTLSGSNGYTGVTTILAGTLSLGGGNALGGGGSLRFGGGTLQAGTNGAIYSNAVTGSGSAILLDSNGQSVTLSGSLDATNTGGLTKFGAGVLTLSGSNGFTGMTTLGSGTLSLGGANALGGGGSLTFGGGTLQYTSANTVDYASRIVNSTAAIGVDTNGQSVTYAGSLVESNTGGLTKMGDGVLTLSGSNSYTGVTIIKAGTLSLGSTHAFARGGSLRFAGGSLRFESGVTTDLSARINPIENEISAAIDTGGNAVTFNSGLSGGGALTKTGQGSLILEGSGSLSGSLGVVAGTLAVGVNGAFGPTASLWQSGGVLDVTAAGAAAASFSMSGGTLNLGTNGALVFSGAATLTDGSAQVYGNVDSANVGRYALLQAAGGLSGTLAIQNVSDSINYYVNVGSNGIDLQRRATVGTVAITAATSALIVGGSTAVTLSVVNNAPVNSDALNFSAVGTGLVMAGSAAATGIVAGASSEVITGFYIRGVSVGTAKSGTIAVTGVDTTNGVVNANVAVDVYDHASTTFAGGTLSLGNVREGYSAIVAGSQSLSVGNASGFRVNLKGSSSEISGVSLTALSGLVAGTSGAIGVNLAAGESAGSLNRTFVYTFGDDSVLNGALANVGTAVISLTGTVYRAGNGVLGSNLVHLGNVREGGSFGVGALALSNGATVDGFSEKLNVSFAADGDNNVVASGSVNLLAAGSSDVSTMTVGLSNTGSAGGKSGTVNLVYETDGTGTSGLASQVVGGTAVTVSGTVYRKAVGNAVAAVELGAIREGGTFTNKSVLITNTASNDGYSDDLLARISLGSAGVTNSGSGALIAAGSQSSGLLLGYHGNTANAGTVSGSATVAYLSMGQSGTGLGEVALERASDAVLLGGKIYRLAQATVNAGTINLGRIHEGSTFPAASLQITNTSANDGYSDMPRIQPSDGLNGLISDGSSKTVAPGDTGIFAVGYNVVSGTVGEINGNLTFGMTSVGQMGTGLADVALGSQTVHVEGQVYSGQGVWMGVSSGVWSDFNNWSTAGGHPGLDGVLSRGVDSATFNSAESVVVQMPYQLVELKHLALLGSGGIRLSSPLGGGGTISLSGSAASVHAAGGNHFVEVPLTLAAPLSVAVDLKSELTLGGILSGGGGFTKLGEGTLVLLSANKYLGQTIVSAGVLELGVGALPGPGVISLAAGTQLAFHLNADLTISNTIVGLGRVVSLDSPYQVFWNGGSTNSANGSVQVAPGISIDFRVNLLSGDGVVWNRSGTLRVSVTAPQLVPNNVVISGSADFSVVAAGALVFGGSVSGDGVLRKREGGTLVLSGSNTYSGGTEVLEGNLLVKSATSLGLGDVKIDALGKLVVSVDPLKSISIANSLSGDGEMSKVGAGTLSLTGTNSNQMGTRIKEGALEVFDSRSLGGRLTMDGGALVLSGTTVLTQGVNFTVTSSVNVRASGDVALTGTLGGAGDVLKDGLGRLLLSGSGALTGRVIVAQGTLKVTNVAALSKVSSLVVGNTGADQTTTVLDVSGLAGGLQLGATQTLKGRGAIIGAVHLNGATLAPGNSIDVERLHGNLALSNAVYEVEYSFLNGGKSDRFEVIASGSLAGTAKINGAVVVPKALDRLTDFAPHRFTILSAEGGIEGQFAEPAQSALIHSTFIYGDPTAAPFAGGVAAAPGRVLAVQLQLQLQSLESAGATGNLKEVGHGVDLLTGTSPSDFKALLLKIYGLQNLAEVRGVLTELNPAAYAELFRLSLLRLEDVQKPVSSRLTIVGAASLSQEAREAREVLAAAAGGSSEWSAWTNAFGSWSAVEADPSQGVGRYSRNEAGDVTGIERRLGRLTLGFIGAKGGGSAQLNTPVASVSSDTWHLGGYVSLPLNGRIFADASAFYGEAVNTIRRTQRLPGGMVSSRSSVIENEWMLETGLGMQLAPQTSDWSLLLTVRGAYMGARQGGAKETGAGAFDVQTDSQTNGTLLIKSGIEGAKEWRMAGLPFRMGGNLEWLHDFYVDSRRVGVRWEGASSAPWTVTGARGQADAIKAGISVDVGLSKASTMRVYGEYEFWRSGPTTRFGVSYTIGF